MGKQPDVVCTPAGIPLQHHDARCNVSESDYSETAGNTAGARLAHLCVQGTWTLQRLEVKAPSPRAKSRKTAIALASEPDTSGPLKL
jgi:hypothetical protein